MDVISFVNLSWIDNDMSQPVTFRVATVRFYVLTTPVLLPTPLPTFKMSWNTYVEDLIKTQSVTKVSICGQDGLPWASSQDFCVSAQEVKTLALSFDNPADLHMKGMIVGGTKYFFLSGTDEVLRAKKGTNGIIACKTKTGVIIAYYEDPIQAGQCAKEVERVADYLKSQNI
ncbi:profilin-like [Homarus americanus]|uniref:profilin-like n=1 Tax=Homarus americanus TaxID=6706 RepID=UPI001C495209|nr:profilin-like [Homarus americanus]